MLKDLVLKNRSYRGYDESLQVSREELAQLVDLTRYTASSVNMQPLKYYLACTKEEVEQIVSITKWAAALSKLHLPHPGTYPAAFIVICQDLKISSSTPTFQRDVGIVAQTILLGATEKGLGGCMIGNFKRKELRDLLHLDDTIEPQLVLAIGKPAEKVVLTSVKEDGKTAYYRDEEGIHYVPKRSLEDILL